MRNFTLALIGLVILIAAAIAVRVVLPAGDDNPGHPVAGAAQAPSATGGMHRGGQAGPALGGIHAGALEETRPAGGDSMYTDNPGVEGPAFPAESGFLGDEAHRPTDAEVKQYIEQRKEALAMQQGFEALRRYHELKQKREQKTLALEEYRKQRREYGEKRREWKLMLEEAREYARMTGDYSQVHELAGLEPVRPERKREQPAGSERE